MTDVKEKAAPKSAAKDYDELTYIPADGDKARTTWNGIEFKAHIPVKVPRTKRIAVLMPIKTPLLDDKGQPVIDDAGNKVMQNGIMQPDGTIQTRHIEQSISMAEMAKTNPRFSVNGAPPPVEIKGSARLPTDSNQYRGFAMNWMQQAEDLETLDARWGHEEKLRESCGVDQSDLAFLQPFLEMRRDQLKAA